MAEPMPGNPVIDSIQNIAQYAQTLASNGDPSADAVQQALGQLLTALKASTETPAAGSPGPEAPMPAPEAPSPGIIPMKAPEAPAPAAAPAPARAKKPTLTDRVVAGIKAAAPKAAGKPVQ